MGKEGWGVPSKVVEMSEFSSLSPPDPFYQHCCHLRLSV